MINVAYGESAGHDNVGAVVEVSSSESHDTDDSLGSFIDDDDESSVEGDEDAYYGGYGTCYRCGKSCNILL